jgi:pimeloyl-ACP methyl ester carboxylesterase
VYRVVDEFNKLGHDVLNISRPGYGGTPVPTSTTPLRDSVPLFIDFIDKVQKEKGHAGIILVGHSMGGALVLSITYEAQGRLPILGVSAMGCLPSLKPLGMLGDTDPDPENPRFIVEPDPENIKRFMGRMEWLNLDALSEEIVAAVFEPGKFFQSRCKKYTKFIRPKIRNQGVSDKRSVRVHA